MLQVSDAAVSVLKREVLHQGDPTHEVTAASAVRLDEAARTDGQQNISVQPVEGPQPGDVPTEANDLDVFLAPPLAEPLEMAVLDARDTPAGAELFLRQQPGLD